MRLLRIFAAMTMALGLIPSLAAFPAQSPPTGSDADTAAIKQVFTDFYENFTRHDAHATAMTFAEDGDFTNMRGVHRRGRKEIEAWFAALFTGSLKDSRRTDIVRSIRFFTPDVATVDADTTITGTKASDGSEVPPRKGLMIATLTKHGGHWMISTFHEAEFPEPRATSADRPARAPANP
ncbi:MAG: SgcJ/EcaC family oxidoreductase [Acidobacteriia bacterium]|nr:SgcJ/EcaC family oxidoreductase [Terriglobia bacterium]